MDAYADPYAPLRVGGGRDHHHERRDERCQNREACLGLHTYSSRRHLSNVRASVTAVSPSKTGRKTRFSTRGAGAVPRRRQGRVWRRGRLGRWRPAGDDPPAPTSTPEPGSHVCRCPDPGARSCRRPDPGVRLCRRAASTGARLQPCRAARPPSTQVSSGSSARQPPAGRPHRVTSSTGGCRRRRARRRSSCGTGRSCPPASAALPACAPSRRVAPARSRARTGGAVRRQPGRRSR
jgi:hypothetical protein